jgi:hypothetical protein
MEMKQFCNVLFLSIVGLFSNCTKSGSGDINDLTQKPLLEFDTQKVYLPSEIKSKKTLEKCNINPYWEGKSIKLEGFTFKIFIDTSLNKVTIYDSYNLSDANNSQVEVWYDNAEAPQIKSLILRNSDKKCQIFASCSSYKISIDDCYKSMRLNLLKLTDIQFK